MAKKQTRKRHRSSEKAGSQANRASPLKEKKLKLNAVILVEEKEFRESVMEELKEELSEWKERLKKELREEVKEELKEEFRKASQTDQGKQPRFRLKIMSTVDEVVYTGSNINTRDYIEVVMLDDGNPIAPDHPLASAKIELVLLNELFKKGDEECWTVDDFNVGIIRRRKRKSEIGNVNQETGTIIRNCTFDLTGGSCCHHGVRIMENSNRKLGVKVVGHTKERVLEGVLSKPFRVKELKTKDYAKHDIPSLDDDIWRLHGIANTCSDIQKEGINTVGDLLSLYCEDYAKLEHILKRAYHHDTKVEAIIKQAKKCGDGLCFYEEGDVVLFFNYEDQLVGAQFSGIYRKLAELEGREKDRAITLSKTAKDNKKSWRGGYKMEGDLPKQWQPRSLRPNSAQPTSVQMLNNVQCSTGGDQQQTFGYGRGNSMGLPPENLDAMLPLPCRTPAQMVEEVQGSTGGGQQQTFGYERGNSMRLPPVHIQMMEQVQGDASFAQHHNHSGSVQLQSFHIVRQQQMKETQLLFQSDAPVYSDPAQHGVPHGVSGQNQDSESSVGDCSTELSLSSLFK